MIPKLRQRSDWLDLFCVWFVSETKYKKLRYSWVSVNVLLKIKFFQLMKNNRD